ncbi:hypothetical protein [Streptomyces sp. NPDC015130]|uniref:hypothetical protein n=1 Tax=Streptomyces sp. NPDC015130 TaxID=3364940 RepID=UPI0036FDA9C0
MPRTPRPHRHRPLRSDLTSTNRRAPIPGLPDRSRPGYRGGAPLPGAAEAHPDAACPPLWVGAANTAKFYRQQTIDDPSRYVNLHTRQQIFRIAAVDTAGENLTLDKPLEYDLPVDSTSDGSAAIGGTVHPSRVTPLKVVQGVGIEDLALTQELDGMPKPGGGAYDVTPADAEANFGNIAPEYAQHGSVLKWAADVRIRRVATRMTGFHAVVTESARNVQVQESSFDGSWNKGKGPPRAAGALRSWSA